MDLQTMLRAVIRRWWVATGVLVLTVVLALITLSAFPPTYFVESDFLLAQGEAAEAPGDEDVAPAVIAAVAASRGFGEDPTSPFNRMPYDLTPVEGSSVISLTAVWSSRDTAVEGIDRLLATLEGTVEDLTGAGTGVRSASVTLLGRGVTTANAPAVQQDDDAEGQADASGGFAATATALIRTTANPQNAYEPSDFTATVLSTLMNAPRNVGTYVERDGVDEFAVLTDPRQPAPLLTVSVAGTDRQGVLEASADAEAEMVDRLTDLQGRDVERGARPTQLQALNRPDGPTLVENNSRRPLAVVVLLGLFVALGASLSVDAMLQKREAQADNDPEGGGSADGSVQQRITSASSSPWR